MGLRGETFVLGFFTLFWSGMTLLATLLAFGMGAAAPLFLIPFWLISMGLAGTTLLKVAGHTTLKINPQQFEVLYCHIKSLGMCFRFSGRTDDLEGIEMTTMNPKSDRPVQGCTLLEGRYSHSFGTKLRPSEKAWLIQEIGDFLKTQQP